MQELVELLKKARLEKGITLEEISNETKVQMRFLEAIENNDFSPFAGEIYIKGVIKHYANAVGLNTEEVMALYRRLKEEEAGDGRAEEAAAGPTQPPRTAQARRRDPGVKREEPAKRYSPPPAAKARQGPSYTAGIVVLALALIIGTIWFTLKNLNYDRTEPEPGDNGAIEDPQDPGKPGGDEPLPEPEPEPEPEPSFFDVELVESTDTEDIYQVSGVEEIQLKVVFDSLCWVRLTVDGEQPVDPRNFRRGEEISFSGKEILIRLGNPRAVQLYINDELVDEIQQVKRARNFLFRLEGESGEDENRPGYQDWQD